jgi:hypothetical protein
VNGWLRKRRDGEPLSLVEAVRSLDLDLVAPLAEAGRSVGEAPLAEAGHLVEAVEAEYPTTTPVLAAAAGRYVKQCSEMQVRLRLTAKQENPTAELALCGVRNCGQLCAIRLRRFRPNLHRLVRLQRLCCAILASLC